MIHHYCKAPSNFYFLYNIMKDYDQNVVSGGRVCCILDIDIELFVSDK